MVGRDFLGHGAEMLALLAPTWPAMWVRRSLTPPTGGTLLPGEIVNSFAELEKEIMTGMNGLEDMWK